MISRNQVSMAVAAWRELIPFFPKGDAAFDIVVECVCQMVGTEDQLKWLMRTACQTMTQFSLPGLRALYCTRFHPSDGLEANVATEGFTEDQLEAQFRMREMQENENRMREYKQLAAANPADYAPFELPPIKKPEAAARPAREPIEKQQPKRDRALQEAEEQLRRDLESGIKRTDDERRQIIDDIMAKLKMPNGVH